MCLSSFPPEPLAWDKVTRRRRRRRAAAEQIYNYLIANYYQV